MSAPSTPSNRSRPGTPMIREKDLPSALRAGTAPGPSTSQTPKTSIGITAAIPFSSPTSLRVPSMPARHQPPATFAPALLSCWPITTHRPTAPPQYRPTSTLASPPRRRTYSRTSFALLPRLARCACTQHGPPSARRDDASPPRLVALDSASRANRLRIRLCGPQPRLPCPRLRWLLAMETFLLDYLRSAARFISRARARHGGRHYPAFGPPADHRQLRASLHARILPRPLRLCRRTVFSIARFSHYRACPPGDNGGWHFAPDSYPSLAAPTQVKSTLLNALLGQKLAIVTHKPQTTRTRIHGVLEVPLKKKVRGETGHPAAQVILVDTPGVHKPETQLDRRMMQEVQDALESRDAVLFLVDVTHRLAKSETPGKAIKATGRMAMSAAEDDFAPFPRQETRLSRNSCA